MGRGGKGDSGSMEECGCSPETIQKVRMWLYDREETSSKAVLTKTFEYLNKVFGRTDKAKKDSLSELAIKVCSMAELVGGLYLAEKSDNEKAMNLLNETLAPIRKDLMLRHKGDKSVEAACEPSRSVFHATIDASYRIKYQQIIIDSLERRLKDKEQQLKLLEKTNELPRRG